MFKVLGGVRNREVYLDDIVAYSSTWSEHITTLRTIFDRLMQASLMLNSAKCEFGRATVTYLEKQMGQRQVRALADKIQAVLDFPEPRRALRRFLQMAGYYPGFCKNFSDVVAPLNSLMSTFRPFE